MNEVLTDEREKIALLNLLSVEGIGTNTVIRLIEQFQSAQAVFEATEAELRAVPKMSATVIARLRSCRAGGTVGTKQLEDAQKIGAEVRTFWDENYPVTLRHLESDAPAVLFILGNFPADAKRLSVVGTAARRPTESA